MKKSKVLYWVITGLFCAFMLFSAIPDIIPAADAVKFMTELGYPFYIIRFLGVAKLLGVIALLVPGYPKIKEWAYAGLFFDLIGATYSNLAKFGFQPPMLIMILPIAFLFISYYLWHKRMLSPVVAANY